MARRKQPLPSPRRRPDRGAAARGGNHRLWLFGIHPVLAALANPQRRCHRLMVTAQAGRTFGPRLDAAGGRDAPPIKVAERLELEQLLSRGAVHQGVALLVDPLPEVPLRDVFDDDAPATVVLLDRASDPHNVGAVLRSAAALGAGAVIVLRRHAPPANGTLAKAASGALETIPLVRIPNLAGAMAILKDAGFWCVGLDAAAAAAIAECDLPDKVALVLGSEGGGLRRLTRENCDLVVRIAMSGSADSLNLSAAAAIALHELARRRGADRG